MEASSDPFLEQKLRAFELVGYKPTPFQREIHGSRATYRVIAAGARFGKSYLAAHEAIAALLQPGVNGWIVTPEHSLGRTIFKYVADTLEASTPSGFLKFRSDRDQYIVTAHGSRLDVKSASNKRSLKGVPLDFAIIDEAAEVDEEAMNLVHVRLMDRRGWALYISTPVGRNWFYKAYLKGQDRESNPDYQSWNAPTWANPYIDPAEVEQRRSDMPERQFRQEIGAEFLDDEGAVFKNINECATLTPVPAPGPEPIVGRQYAVSADLGRHQDYTAVLVWDIKQKSAVHFEYFQGSWDTQTRRIKAICERYNRATLIVDATGEGDAVFERLRHDNNTEHFAGRVYGEQLYSAKRKQEIVEALILAMERKDVSYVRHPRLIKELGMYEFHRTPRAQVISYGAPAGQHDDGVMSLALGWSLIGRLRSTAVFKMGAA